MFFRKKKEKEPASYLSPLGTELTNYNVYYLNFREKLQAFAIALFIGGAVSLVFTAISFWMPQEGLRRPQCMAISSFSCWWEVSAASSFFPFGPTNVRKNG